MCLQDDKAMKITFYLLKVCAHRPALIRLVTKMRQSPPSVSSAIHQPIHHDFFFTKSPSFTEE